MINEYYAHKYCRDDISKIENYEDAINDKTQMWVVHHRLELTLDGKFAISKRQLKMHDMYYNRPYYELIFLTMTDHCSLHSKGRIYSEEIRNKFSEVAKGKAGTNLGKKFSENWKNNMKKTWATISKAYKEYKLSGGTLSWNEFTKVGKEKR